MIQGHEVSVSAVGHFNALGRQPVVTVPSLLGSCCTQGGCVGLQAHKGVRLAPSKPVPLILTPQVYLHRLSALAALQAAWSPICTFAPADSTGGLGWAPCATLLNAHMGNLMGTGPKCSLCRC